MDSFDPSLSRKAVRFVVYNSKDRTTAVVNRLEGARGYAVGFEGVVKRINDLVPKTEHIGAALREDIPLFPIVAVRENVANALIHQDFTVTGAGPLVELFSDRLEISNPGAPLVTPDRMIDLPPRSRNEALAALMRRMGVCEEVGTGIDKVVASCELRGLPAPLFRAADGSTQIVLYGPRSFGDMTRDERVRACYFHAVLKFLNGERMKNASLCQRLGIAPKNAAQATLVINKTLEAGLIKAADPDRPRGGYAPFWA
jgi:ATP-dependent DNA helicase RecG